MLLAAVRRKIRGMAEEFKGGQVGKIRKGSKPDGWFVDRTLSKSAPADARKGPRSSGTDPGKHPDRLGRIIAKLTGRDKK